MFFENFPVFLLNFERVMSFGGFFVCFFLWTQTAIQNVELPLLFLHCELQRHLEKVEGWDSKHLKDSFAASKCPICAMFDIDIFCYDLVSFKGFDLSPLTFSPLWSMQNMLWCLWVEAERWYGLILMCKYCLYIYIFKYIYKQKKTTISKWETNVKWLTLQNENHLKIMSWWMLSEIFFYILKSLEKKRTQLAKWEKLSEEHYKGNVFINL